MKSTAYGLVRGALLGLWLVSCAEATQAYHRASDYSKQEDACLDASASCEDYLACQHKAQAEAGYPLTGSCDSTEAAAP